MTPNDVKPTTHQRDLANLPPALLPLIERPQDWAVVWGERHKAAATEQRAASNDGNGFNGNGSKYGIDEIEQIIREGAPAGADRSGVFHAVIGHLWAAVGMSIAYLNTCSNTHMALVAGI